MKLRLVKIFVLAAILIFSRQIPAGDNDGVAGAQFLKMELDAKWAAMSGGSTALSEDASSLYLNPAGLSSDKVSEFKVSGLQAFGSDFYTAMSYSQPILKYGTAALGIFYDGTSIDDISIWDTTITAGYAYNHKVKNYGEFAGGIAAKYIHQSIDKYAANSGAVDIGLKYISSEIPLPAFIPLKNQSLKISGGMAIQNLGPGVKFITVSDPLPILYKVGFGVKWLFSPSMGLVLGNDLYIHSDDDPEYRIGAEYQYKFSNVFCSARLGMTTNSQNLGLLSNLSSGLGIIYGIYSLDYSFVWNGLLKQSHRVTLSAKFDLLKNKKKEDDTNEKKTAMVNIN